MNRILLTLFLANVWGMLAPGQASENSLAGYAIYLDQDFFVPAKNEDRDYTMGFGIEWFWEAEPHSLGFLDKTLGFLNEKVGSRNAVNVFQKSLMLGSLTFTPDDLGNPDPILDDRPYASIWYLSGKRLAIRQSANGKGRDTTLGSEFLIGILGSDFSKNFQTEFHQAYRSVSNTDEPVDPLGWDHQIANGGEATLRYRQSFGQSLVKEKYFDLAYTSDISLGFQTNASIGTQFRIGKLDSGFWTLPYDPINRGSFIPADKGSELYFWGAYRARLIGYDALIQGQFRSSEVAFSYNEMQQLVHETGFGATYGNRRFQTSLSASYKSSELKISNERSHFWGSIAFVWRLR